MRIPKRPTDANLVSDGRRLKNGSAHVHAVTTDDAIRPVFTRLPAVENHSNVFLVPSHFVSVLTNIVTVRAMISPVPSRITYPIPSEKAHHRQMLGTLLFKNANAKGLVKDQTAFYELV